MPVSEDRAGPARIVLDTTGTLLRANTAARTWFPGLERAGLEHPLLDPLPDHLGELAFPSESRTSWTQAHEGRRYQVTLHYEPEEQCFHVTFEPVDED